MNEISIVCCYNNEKMYNDFVGNVNSQSIPCEVIGINNCGNKTFTSCAAAYNSVINQVKTKYVIYSHQDIVLEDSDSLKKFLSYLERLNTHDVLGVAGVKFDSYGVFTNIKHVWKHSGEIGFAGSNRVEGGLMECDTVDECFFGGFTEHFKEFPFNEKICNNWHLYAVEACLQTKSNYVKGGGGSSSVH